MRRTGGKTENWTPSAEIATEKFNKPWGGTTNRPRRGGPGRNPKRAEPSGPQAGADRSLLKQKDRHRGGLSKTMRQRVTAAD